MTAARALRVPSALAARLERSPAVPGTVHSVFAGAVNVRLPDGRLLALHGPGDLRAPFALALDRWPLPAAIRPGMPAAIGARAVALGAVRIDTSGAARVDLGPRGGAGPWPRALAGLRAPAVAAALGAAPGAAAAQRLAWAMAAADPAAFAAAATALIGLGEGLTPAGDDCLVGALAGLRRARHPLAADRELARALGAAARARTTDLGREFLAHALDGGFAEALLDVVSGDAARAARGAAALLAGGASSGADTLHGVRLAAAACWANVRRQARPLPGIPDVGAGA